MDIKALGSRIKKERNKLHITQQKLAEALNLSTDFIGCIERGERKISLETLVTIASYFNVSLDYLVFGNLATPADSHKNDLETLLDKCSLKDREILTDVIKTLLPHLKELEIKR